MFSLVDFVGFYASLEMFACKYTFFFFIINTWDYNLVVDYKNLNLFIKINVLHTKSFGNTKRYCIVLVWSWYGKWAWHGTISTATPYLAILYQ